MNPKQSVLVGVTGERENTEALRFALAEARLAGCGITLVHAVHPMLPPPPPSVLMTDDTWSEVGAMIVSDVRHELDELAGDDPVLLSRTVRQGSPAEVLSGLSSEAHMIVLQHRELTPLRRVVTHSTVASVAAHASCPVVSVPSSWDGRSHGSLAVGVHYDGGPRQVLEAAFAEAALRHCSLQVLHAWRPLSGDDLLSPGDVRWTEQDQAELAAGVEELRAKYPDVEVTFATRQDDAADALVRTGKLSDLLVVGRHSGLPLLPRRLGHVARSVIARSSCPVMVVPM